MFEEDYIMRMFNQFFEDLSLFLSKGRMVNKEKEIQILYETYFHPSVYYYEKNIHDIYALFSQYSQEEQIYRMSMLAELFYQDALIQNSDLKNSLLEKSLFLFETIETKSNTFSLDRRMRIRQIEGILKTH